MYSGTPLFLLEFFLIHMSNLHKFNLNLNLEQKVFFLYTYLYIVIQILKNKLFIYRK